MNIQFLAVSTPGQLAALSAAAREIWFEYYPALLSPEQIAYMVETFQTAEAMGRLIAQEGYLFFLLMEGETVLGYLAVKPEGEKLFLSKAYLKKAFRGRGIFSRMLKFAENIARERGLGAIYLTVNKHNANSIAVYCKKGFHIAREAVTDIGHGFVMDDYIMEKALPSRPPILPTGG